MSRARKLWRDANKRGEPPAFNKKAFRQQLDQTFVKEQDVPQTEYKFSFNTPSGAVSFKVPHEGMKVCPCGCDLFEMAYRVGYVKPANAIGVEPTCVRVEVLLCRKCAREVGPADPTIADLKARANGKVANLLE